MLVTVERCERHRYRRWPSPGKKPDDDVCDDDITPEADGSGSDIPSEKPIVNVRCDELKEVCVVKVCTKRAVRQEVWKMRGRAGRTAGGSGFNGRQREIFAGADLARHDVASA